MKITRSPDKLKSHVGHLAARAIFRWMMPTPACFKKSSKPSVAMQVHVPIKICKESKSIAAVACSSGISAGTFSAVEARFVSAPFESSFCGSSSMSVESTVESNIMDDAECMKDLLLLNKPFDAEGDSKVAAVTRDSDSRRAPVVCPCFVSQNSFSAKSGMPSLHGTTTLPHKLSVPTRVELLTLTSRAFGMFSDRTVHVDSHLGCLSAEVTTGERYTSRPPMLTTT
mmetsp:Transcript_76837/g.150685  ORF Transcript_76837/g.150685 Transcript_76837/m.150685 type:complete len:227 (-) Transcript_76837:188-868(-)